MRSEIFFMKISWRLKLCGDVFMVGRGGILVCANFMILPRLHEFGLPKSK